MNKNAACDFNLAAVEHALTTALEMPEKQQAAFLAKLAAPVRVEVETFRFDEVGDAPGRRRFQREAQTASPLNDPHILSVHDVGEFQGSQFMVTEFVDAGTLEDWARAQKRTWREIVRY